MSHQSLATQHSCREASRLGKAAISTPKLPKRINKIKGIWSLKLNQKPPMMAHFSVNNPTNLLRSARTSRILAGRLMVDDIRQSIPSRRGLLQDHHFPRDVSLVCGERDNIRPACKTGRIEYSFVFAGLMHSIHNSANFPPEKIVQL